MLPRRALRALGYVWGALALVACGADGEAPPAPEVVGQTWPLWGGEIDTEHQGVVMVGHSRQPPGCSGTLIAPNLVITAQHCVAMLTNTEDMDICNHEFGATFDRPYALLGDTLFGPTEIILASEVVVPEGCKSTCGCDVALLILERNAPDPSVAIGVQTGRQPYEDQPFELVAFGTTDQMGNGFGVRRHRSTKVMCFSWGCGPGALSTNEFAATSAGCEGDSGGPGIDDEGLLLGVISRTSFPCTDPDALNVYTSVQWTFDLIADTAQRAAEMGGYPVPDWAEPPPATDGVCATVGFCGPHMEADGTAVDCGACIAPEVCGWDGMCVAPIAAPEPTAGASGGPIGDMFQGVWCKGVVCPTGWVCAGEATCAMPCDPAAPKCDEGTTCDAIAGACLAAGMLSASDAGVASGGGGGGCTVVAASGTGAPGTGSAFARLALVAPALWLRRRIRRDSRRRIGRASV